jgi:Transglutaminase-like superfamily
MRRFRLFRLMSPVERRITIEALLLPIAISSGFRLVGVPRTQAWLRRWALKRKPGSQLAIDDIVGMACRAQRRVSRTTGILGPCLVRSLTLWTVLASRGIEVSLRIGFRKRDGKFEGHAWVERDQSPLNENETEAKTYTVSEQPACFDLWAKQGRVTSGRRARRRRSL